MPRGRDSGQPSTRRRWALRALGAAALVAVGIAIGTRIAGPKQTEAITTVTRAAPSPETPTMPATHDERTPAGAVAAAATSVQLLDGPALLDSARVQRIVDGLAALSARGALARAYAQGAAQARSKLGVDSVPAPVVILRAAPVGYRIESFSRAAATVDIWCVGVVGSGATVQPQQSWRTETVSLVWERGAWKVAAFASSAGPTPPLTASTATTTANDLFTEVPRFKEFSRELP